MALQPDVEFLPGIQGKQIQLHQELLEAVPDTVEQIDQLTVHIVEHFKFGFWFSQEDRSGSTEHIDIPRHLLGENRVQDRQRSGFVADAGYWGSDRLSRSIHNGNGRYGAWGQTSISAIWVCSDHFHYKNGAAPILKCARVLQFYHLLP